MSGAVLSRRYLTEGSPRLQHFAEIATSLARHLPIEERELEAGGLNCVPA